MMIIIIMMIVIIIIMMIVITILIFFRHEVFQRITENANAAMLHFQSPIYPELAVQSFMTYLHSYLSLFSDKCKQCGDHLRDNLPPTWREFRTLEPYHQNCRP